MYTHMAIFYHRPYLLDIRLLLIYNTFTEMRKGIEISTKTYIDTLVFGGHLIIAINLCVITG